MRPDLGHTMRLRLKSQEEEDWLDTGCLVKFTGSAGHVTPSVLRPVLEGSLSDPQKAGAGVANLLATSVQRGDASLQCL